MAKINRNTVLFVSILCMGIESMCGAVSLANTNTVKLPWDAQPMPNHPPPQQQASIDPETLKELVEFQEIVTEGVPLLLKLFNRLMKNKFAKPLVEVLLTCDKQKFMVSCVQGIFQKIIGILTKQAEPKFNGDDGVRKSHGHLQPHTKENRAQSSKTEDVENVLHENDVLAKSEKARVTTGDGGITVDPEYQSEPSDDKVKENNTQPAKAKQPHTPLGPTSANHKSEL